MHQPSSCCTVLASARIRGSVNSGGALEQRFRLITPDLRGHGRSDKPRPPETYTDGRRWAEDIAAIIDGLEVERPVLLAWSYS